MRDWTPQEQAEFRRLLSAQFSPNQLTVLLFDRLERNLFNYVAPADEFPLQLLKVVLSSCQEGWHYELLFAVIAERPRHDGILAFAQRMNVIAGYERGFEKLVTSGRFQDLAVIRKRMEEFERQVCRVETPSGFGTGFLVAPDLVMTNYHVVEGVVAGTDSVPAVVCRFDYKVDEDGDEIFAGTEHRLATGQPIMAYSKYATEDATEGLPLSSSWGQGAYDYALLRLTTAAGDERFGPSKNMDSTDSSPKRGWVKASAVLPKLAPDQGLIIVQHPSGDPVKFAYDSQSIEGLNGNETRVRYRTNTEPGSSGGPCLTESWAWIALHHAGDPAWTARYNQGIPLRAILDDLKNKGMENLLGK